MKDNWEEPSFDEPPADWLKQGDGETVNTKTGEVLEESNLPAVQPSGGVLVEQSRAVSETQSALVIAKRFPRDQVAAHKRIMDSCKRLKLAEQAVYKLPIGGKVQQGPSIRLAEELARQWGNIKFGVREIERGNARSKCIAFCWDQETNTSSEIEFDVEHWIEVGAKGNKTRKPITDPVEIDRLIANRGARKLRNCILSIVPGDVVEDAVKACRSTVSKGGGEPLIDRVRKMVAAFGEVGVNQEMLEKKLGHQIDLTTGEEIAEMTAIFKAIADKEAKRGKFFDFPDENEDDDARAAARAKIDEKLKGAP